MCGEISINGLQHQTGAKAHDFSDGFTNGVATALFGSVSQLSPQAWFVSKARGLDLKHLKPLSGQHTILNDPMIAILLIRVDVTRSTQPLHRRDKEDSIRGSSIALSIFIVLGCLLYELFSLEVDGHRETAVKTGQYSATQFIEFFNIVRLRHEATHHEE